MNQLVAYSTEAIYILEIEFLVVFYVVLLLFSAFVCAYFRGVVLCFFFCSLDKLITCLDMICSGDNKDSGNIFVHAVPLVKCELTASYSESDESENIYAICVLECQMLMINSLLVTLARFYFIEKFTKFNRQIKSI